MSSPASPLQPADQPAREAALNTDNSVLVEAPAGARHDLPLLRPTQDRELTKLAVGEPQSEHALPVHDRVREDFGRRVSERVSVEMEVGNDDLGLDTDSIDQGGEIESYQIQHGEDRIVDGKKYRAST